MSKKIIDVMVDRFLSWQLPKDFCPDAGIKFTPLPQPPFTWPVGTNLLTAQQAREMIVHIMTDAIPEEHRSTEEEGEAFTAGYFTREAEQAA
jgi:hypothetical protein